MKLSQQKSCCNIWYLLQWHILLQKPITAEFITTVKTYYHRVYCNGLQQLIFVAIKVYCNKMKVITTKNFVVINLFSCSASWAACGFLKGRIYSSTYPWCPSMFYEFFGWGRWISILEWLYLFSLVSLIQ